ncbi:hypothetical protein [Azospirillum sp. sgz302134]
MDMDTAITVLNTLDEAERILGEVRLHNGAGACREMISRNRELLEEARHRLEAAQELA